MTSSLITSAPCSRCPFRKDVPIFLRQGRREEIAHALLNDQTFHCHAEVEYDEDDEGEEIHDVSGARMCAGAAKSLMLSGGSTNLMRVASRIGAADLDRTLEHPIEVWPLSDWTQLAEGSTGDAFEFEEMEGEPCNTVNEGCLAPAGYLGAGGGVIHGTEVADGECPSCGEAVCSNCADEQGRCGMCTEEEDDESE